MKYRTRKYSDEKWEELDMPITLKVYTKCPEKWMLIDGETGEVYRGKKVFDSTKDNGWQKLPNKDFC